tara:strand:+ start:702 stop:1115 length:414 start_codon:yes stop_codon:yes gene_type:complete
LNYAGDISATEAWNMLMLDSESSLVDVRTFAEVNFVGVPDLYELGKKTIWVEWQNFPDGKNNQNFLEELEPHISSSSDILFLCRSGSRSRNAAIFMSEVGFKNCYNVADGFEGNLDQGSHRSNLNGWKSSGLPWKQS